MSLRINDTILQTGNRVQKRVVTFTDDLLVSSDNNNSYTYRLPLPTEVTKIKCRNIFIPQSIYDIDNHNNTLRMAVSADYNDIKSVTIPSGHYDDITDILAELKSALDTAFSPRVFTLTLDQKTNYDTNKVKIDVDSGDFRYIDAGSTLNSILNISDGEDLTNDTYRQSASSTLTGTLVHGFGGGEFYTLSIPNLSSSSNFAGFDSTVVAQIFNFGAGRASYEKYEDETFIELNGTRNLEDITIRLLDDRGRAINVRRLRFTIEFVMPNYDLV